MVLFGQTHKEFLRPYVSLPDGIPSHDTFRRVFSMLEPDVLRTCLNDCGKDYCRVTVRKTNLFRQEKTHGRVTREQGQQRPVYSQSQDIRKSRVRRTKESGRQGATK
jgi:hypothetical protein